MTKPGNNVKGFDNIDDALSFASSPVVEKRKLCRVTNRNSKVDGDGLLFAPEAPLHSHLLSLLNNTQQQPLEALLLQEDKTRTTPQVKP